MTPEERDRLTRTEVLMSNLDRDVQELREEMREMKALVQSMHTAMSEMKGGRKMLYILQGRWRQPDAGGP